MLHTVQHWHWIHDCAAIYPCAVLLQCVPDMQSPAPHINRSSRMHTLTISAPCSSRMFWAHILLNLSHYIHATLTSLQAIGSMGIFASDLMSVRRAGGQCFCLLYQDFINWTISQAYHEICLCRWWMVNQNIILHAWASVQTRKKVSGRATQQDRYKW